MKRSYSASRVEFGLAECSPDLREFWEMTRRERLCGETRSSWSDALNF
jgi:hypothetical protein